MGRRDLAEARNHAEALINQTERTLGEHGEKVAAADKSAIEAEIASLKTALESQDAGEIKAKTEALARAAMKLGEAMYKPDEAGGDSGGGPETAGNPSSGPDNVVDADFEEVDEKKRKGSN
jgi:molecular chaperone DnaK